VEDLHINVPRSTDRYPKVNQLGASILAMTRNRHRRRVQQESNAGGVPSTSPRDGQSHRLTNMRDQESSNKAKPGRTELCLLGSLVTATDRCISGLDWIILADDLQSNRTSDRAEAPPAYQNVGGGKACITYHFERPRVDGTVEVQQQAYWTLNHLECL
jgi:hypothetical protein